MRNVKEYYKHLGKLTYAVAIADGLIQPEEKETLEKEVLKLFVHHETTLDTSGMNTAFYVNFEFEASHKKRPELNETLKDFSDFIEQNYEPEDTGLLQRSVTLLEDISTVCSKEREKNIVSTIKNKINSTLYI